MSKHVSEIQIPNGYYQLWLRYLSAQGKIPEQLGFSPAQLQQLQHVLALPMDTQSSYQFFNDIIQHSIQFLDCPTLVLNWHVIFSLNILACLAIWHRVVTVLQKPFNI